MLFLYCIPVSYKICGDSSKDKIENCASYRIPFFLFAQGIKITNDYGGLITAIEYRGHDNIVRSTGFCREFTWPDGVWRRVPDSTDEYAY